MSIQTSIVNQVARIEIARPEKKNALTAAMYAALAQALRVAGEDSAVRAILLHGQADIFTSGNDLEDFKRAGAQANAESPARVFMDALTETEKPVVVAVNGLAVGIGTTLLPHCDLVYLAHDAVLKMPFVQLGLCAEFGSSLVLPALAGHARVAEKLLLGDPITPEEAVELGIATRVLPAADVLSHAHTQAERFGQLPPEAVRTTKRLMRQGQAAALREHIGVELAAFRQRLASAEAQEAFSAFFERRKPDFSRF